MSQIVKTNGKARGAHIVGFLSWKRIAELVVGEGDVTVDHQITVAEIDESGLHYRMRSVKGPVEDDDVE